MRYVLVTDTPLAAAIVAKAVLPEDALLVLCKDAPLARQLRKRGFQVAGGRLERDATWNKVTIDDQTLAVVALADDGATLETVRRITAMMAEAPVLVLDVSHDDAESVAAGAVRELRNVERVRLSDVVRGPFQQKFENALVRRRVHRYRDHFELADRVLILMHDDPDPDAIASALALRALLGRNRQTAIIGTFKYPTRPENLRLIQLLAVDIKEIVESDLPDYDRVAVVDTQPHIFGGKLSHADLVIDHHPLRTGYTATFRDIRTAFGATTSLVLDYLIRCDIPISERIATAAVYAIKTDTWTFRRGTVPEDVNIFAHVYPRANQAVLRRIETEGFNLETLRLLARLTDRLELVGRFVHVHAGDVSRDDLVPTVADFLMNLAEVQWTAVSGVLGDTLTLSVRNLGNQRSAGDIVQQIYGSLGSAGGHRSAAKALIPLDVVRKQFGEPDHADFARRLFRPLWEAAGAADREDGADG